MCSIVPPAFGISRDWIADSVELVTRGHLLDGLVTLSGCDKTIPAMVMAMARVNVPSVMLYGGSILFGEHRGKRTLLVDVARPVIDTSECESDGRCEHSASILSKARLPASGRAGRGVDPHPCGEWYGLGEADEGGGLVGETRFERATS